MLNFYSSKGFCNLHMEAKSVNLVLFCFVFASYGYIIRPNRKSHLDF